MKKHRGLLKKLVVIGLFLSFLLVAMRLKQYQDYGNLVSGGRGTFMHSASCRIEGIFPQQLDLRVLEAIELTEMDGTVETVLPKNSRLRVLFPADFQLAEGANGDEAVIRFLDLTLEKRSDYYLLASPMGIQINGEELLPSDQPVGWSQDRMNATEN